jgi:atypical dual specificity phosphatase
MSGEIVQQLETRLGHDSPFRNQLLESPVQTLLAFDLTEEEKQHFIVPNFGWLIENRLAGVSYPRSEDALALLWQLGVRALLSLTVEPVSPDLQAHYGFQVRHIPVADLTAPTLDQVKQAIAGIDDFFTQGLPVAVHCGAGIGRTGTVLACYLVSQGSSAKQAIEQVRTKRPGSIETSEQVSVVELYELYQS